MHFIRLQMFAQNIWEVLMWSVIQKISVRWFSAISTMFVYYLLHVGNDSIYTMFLWDNNEFRLTELISADEI